MIGFKSRKDDVQTNSFKILQVQITFLFSNVFEQVHLQAT